MKHKKFIKIIPLFLPALLLGEVTILDSIKVEEKTEKKGWFSWFKKAA